jgi:hypothetical protein
VHPDEELTPEVFERLKDEAYKPYASVRQLGRMPVDDQYVIDIRRAGGRFADRGQDFGGHRFESIGKEKEGYLNATEFDAGGALDEIRQLRVMSRQNLATYNPEANALGYTQRQIADALENRIDRYATANGMTDLVKQLRAARMQLAKISNVEDAIGAGGHVRANDLKRLLDKGVPLSDSLRTIAETATNFPKAVQDIAKKGETGAWSAVDYLLGGSGLVTGHPAVAALSVARPVSRYALRSEAAQKAMISDLRRKPGVAGKAAATTARAAASAVPSAAKGGAALAAEDDQ